MRISNLIKELKSVQAGYGDIEVELQSNPSDEDYVVGYETFFVVPEQYQPDDGGMICNIRSWPY